MNATKEKDTTRVLTEHAEDLAMLGSLCSALSLLPLRVDETRLDIKERIDLSLLVHGVDPNSVMYAPLHSAMFIHYAVEREKLIRCFVALGDHRERHGKPRVACECMACDSIKSADLLRKSDIKNKSGLMHILKPERYADFCKVNDHKMVRLLDPTIPDDEKLSEADKEFFHRLTRTGAMLSKIYSEFRQRQAPPNGLDELLASMGIRREDVRVISVEELLSGGPLDE